LRRKPCYTDIYHSLNQELGKIRKELEEYCKKKECPEKYSVRGILLCDDSLLFFQRGEAGSYLFNRRFNRTNRKNLSVQGGSELVPVPGMMQCKIGILLCTSEFGTGITREDMIQVLFEERLDDKKIERRLREIRKADLEAGVTAAVGAIFIRLE